MSDGERQKMLDMFRSVQQTTLPKPSKRDRPKQKRPGNTSLVRDRKAKAWSPGNRVRLYDPLAAPTQEQAEVLERLATRDKPPRLPPLDTFRAGIPPGKVAKRMQTPANYEQVASWMAARVPLADQAKLARMPLPHYLATFEAAIRAGDFPTEAEKRLIANLSRLGMPIVRIARAVQVSEATLRKRAGDCLAKGAEDAYLTASGALMERIEAGCKDSIQFFLKTRGNHMGGEWHTPVEQQAPPAVFRITFGGEEPAPLTLDAEVIDDDDE